MLNRIDHSLAVVDTSAMTLMETIPLHDPSSLATRMGRNFLYEATTASAHGDAACSSCHLFGDMDGLAWELGNPGGEMIPYTTPFDNVRFVDDQGDDLCNDSGTSCADHAGFDPQKGPMVTMTLRGMLEPLHSRGDRPTFNDFNRTFVELMGVTDIAPAGQDPAGVPDELMEEFRQFALEIRFPPNPHRMVNDLPPNEEVQVHGNILPGNPRQGRKIFKDRLRWIAAYSCTQCHNLNTGTRKGVLGGVEPEEPASTHVTRLHRGTFLTEFPVRHFDLEVPQLRNMYERFGPNPSPTLTPIPAVAGFGYAHDGSIPDLVRFSTNKTFTLVNGDSFQELRDLSALPVRLPHRYEALGRPPDHASRGNAADRQRRRRESAGHARDLRRCRRGCPTLRAVRHDSRRRQTAQLSLRVRLVASRRRERSASHHTRLAGKRSGTDHLHLRHAGLRTAFRRGS